MRTDDVIPRTLAAPERPDRFLALSRSVLDRLAAHMPRTAVRTSSRNASPVPRSSRSSVAPTSASSSPAALVALTVSSRRVVAEDVVELELRPAAAGGAVLPVWHPGAHIVLTLPSGLTRAYSLCGSPAVRDRYRVAVRRVERGRASQEVHDRLCVGDPVLATRPRNTFPYARPHLSRGRATAPRFIAGGIGITAVGPMVRAAHADGADWHLTYFGPRRSRMAYLDELAGLDPRRIQVHLSDRDGRPGPQQLLNTAGAGDSLYFCGPPGVGPALFEAAAARGVRAVHQERFVPAVEPTGDPFTVVLGRTGERVDVPGDTSALDAVIRHRPDTAFSCRHGFCGTCQVRVLGGTPQRRGTATFLDAGEAMLLCVDRGSGDEIVVDL